MLSLLCSLRSYSGCFTSTRRHWLGTFIYGVYCKGGPHWVFLCYFKCLSTLRTRRWILFLTTLDCSALSSGNLDSWNCYCWMDPHNLWFSLGQIKIIGKFENYFYMHICRTLGVLFWFFEIGKMSSFLTEARFPRGNRERGAQFRGFWGAGERWTWPCASLASKVSSR